MVQQANAADGHSCSGCTGATDHSDRIGGQVRTADGESEGVGSGQPSGAAPGWSKFIASQSLHRGNGRPVVRVGVIGSGIGGLCTAVGLQRAGVEVVVYEQAADLRPGGSGLSVFANGLRALEVLGLGAEFRRITSDKAGELRSGQRRPDGAWLSTFPKDAVAQLRVVDRTDLHRMLVSSLDEGTIRAGRRVVDPHPDGTLAVTHADHGKHVERFDVIVAADGLRSATRRTWPDDPGVSYAGYSAWRGITDTPVDLHGEAGETWGVGRRFGIAPLADGRVYWFAVATMPVGQAFADEKAALHDMFGRWHDPVPDLIDATSPERISRLPIEELAGRLRSFRRGRVVLLGDAAHAMTPDLGQGGGQAMEDAATLVTLLSPLANRTSVGEHELDDALDRYDALRRPRSQRIAQRSRMVGQLAHVRGRPAAGLRDLLVRLTPERALRRQLEWLQSWAPPM